MHLATLVTNTDLSDFARARDLDDVKFAAMIRRVRPEWQVTGFDVHRGLFPDDIAAFDGVMITGSPASVTDTLPWIAPLKAMVADIIARRQPLFGACFGHQLIATVQGAKLVRNPSGWGHGRIPVTAQSDLPWAAGLPVPASLYGSHIEQVDALPAGATLIASSPGCPVAGFRVERHVFTTQHHPEMEPDFIADLVEELVDYVGPEVTEAARASLSDPADSRLFAEQIARFFEAAKESRA